MAMTLDTSKPWWECEEEEMGEEVSRIVDGLKKDQAGRRARYSRNLSLYEGREMTGYSAYTYTNFSADNSSEDSFTEDRFTLIRSAVETAVAEIYGPQKPKPQFQTLGATWSVRRKAYKLDRICEGILNQRQGRFINMWAFMRDASVETALQGVACIKVEADREAKRIVHRLIPLPDMFTDPVEGRDPKCLFYREPIDEHEALAQFAGSSDDRSSKIAHAIRNAGPYDWYDMPAHTRARSVKTVEIIYAYRLPLGPDMPGKWCAIIDDVVVDSGDWTAPSFPFVFVLWDLHRDGFWGSGIGDIGRRQAREVGELDERLMIRHLEATGNYMFYPEGSLQAPRDLEGNDSVRVVAYNGPQPPTMAQRVPFSPVEMEHMAEKKANFWDSIGISQTSAAARREQNISSAIGQITLNEIKAGRQLPKAERYEQAFVDLAHQWVWRLRELKEEDPELVVEWSGFALLQRIKFSDADPEDDAEMTVSVAPSSAMPHDPAGRQELADILYRQGVISQERYAQLLGWNDLEDAVTGERSEQEYIDSLIDRYLDAQEETWGPMDYQAPEGFIMDKMGALRRFTNAWFKARLDQMTLKADEKLKAEFSISLLTRYIQELDALMQPPEAPPAPGPDIPAAQGATPPGQLPQLGPPPTPGPPPIPMAG